MREALYYEKKDKGVRCILCPHYCRLQAEEKGLCGVRRESEGKLCTLNYGVCAAMGMDPIEKKPLYHFYPGRNIFSLGTLGCNLGCGFCQNWQLARRSPGVQTTELTPGEVLGMLQGKQTRLAPVGAAYTYAEPGIWYEFIRDTAPLLQENGYKNVMVTNGFLNKEPLRELLPFIDAFNVDVKAFSEEFYRQHCGGRLSPVLRYVETVAASAHVELTYLVIPEKNDSEKEVQAFVDWVASLSPEIPVHFTRYFPGGGFTLPATPPAVMHKVYDLARQKLQYVYLGNMPGSDTTHTNCRQCGAMLVRRDGYRVQLSFSGSKCVCGKPIPFII